MGFQEPWPQSAGQPLRTYEDAATVRACDAFEPKLRLRQVPRQPICRKDMAWYNVGCCSKV